MSGQNESDLPVIPTLKFMDEAPHMVGELRSPTADLEPKKVAEYSVLIDMGAGLVLKQLRDPRKPAEITAAWLAATNRIQKKGRDVGVAGHVFHEKLKTVDDAIGVAPEQPPAWTCDPEDLIVFAGDEDGVGYGAFLADLVKGIARAS